MSSLSFSISFEGSDIALAINEKTMLLPLVHISSTSTSPYLNNAPNFARPVPPDNEMMKVIANLVTELSPPESYPSLLVLYDSSSQYSKVRSEEHTSELQSRETISYAVFCLKKKKKYNIHYYNALVEWNTLLYSVEIV